MVIYCADGKLDAATALQMTGRSCRHQGKGRVMLFLRGDPAVKKDAWSRLRATSQHRTDDGGKNLKRLFEHALNRKWTDIAVLKGGFENNKWQVPSEDFAFERTAACVLLNKLDRDREALAHRKESPNKAALGALPWLGAQNRKRQALSFGK